MSGDSNDAGGMDRLIEQLRLSDARRPHQNQAPLAPPPGFNIPSSLDPPQAKQDLPSQIPPSVPPVLPRHQTHGGPWSPTGPKYQQNAQHASRPVSLMDYVKTPRNQPLANNQYPRNQPMGHFQSHPGGQTPVTWNQPPMFHAGASAQQSPRPRFQSQPAVSLAQQSVYLDRLASTEIPNMAISPSEVQAKDAFRAKLELTCQSAFHLAYPESTNKLHFIPYGSMLSGFAVKGSDMDLICAWDEAPPDLAPEIIPRLFQAALLAEGFGARALTNTRVPILKICQKPTDELKVALLDDHEQWENRPPTPKDAEQGPNLNANQTDADSKRIMDQPLSSTSVSGNHTNATRPQAQVDSKVLTDAEPARPAENSVEQDSELQKVTKVWLREKVQGPLDFPKNGVGFQTDISFRSLLGVSNTQLLRCYSACDPRVRDMVLFVKIWAKRRKINSSYSGTLCSYGWVLLVLHFLINVASPPVLPNLQAEFRAAHKPKIIDGYNVAFADDEIQLRDMAAHGRITRNNESLGSLLCNFFHYYAHQGPRVIKGGFRWRTEVISIRTPGGILTKEFKDWTGAKNTTVNNVKVQQRYLLAVECPLETNHNVARTVHHTGVVTIRDELRRAWDILEVIGQGRPITGGLLDEASNVAVVASSPSHSKPMGQQRRGNTTEAAFVR